MLRPGGVFAGVDAVGSFLFRLIHLGDTYNPVNPDRFGQRLEAAGFADVAVERGRSRFRFRAKRAWHIGSSHAFLNYTGESNERFGFNG